MAPVTSSAQAASFGEANISSMSASPKTPAIPAGTEPSIKSQPVLDAPSPASLPTREEHQARAMRHRSAP